MDGIPTLAAYSGSGSDACCSAAGVRLAMNAKEILGLPEVQIRSSGAALSWNPLASGDFQANWKATHDIAAPWGRICHWRSSKNLFSIHRKRTWESRKRRALAVQSCLRGLLAISAHFYCRVRRDGQWCSALQWSSCSILRGLV